MVHLTLNTTCSGMILLTLVISTHFLMFQFSTEIVVTVSIKDVNDHIPMFTNLPDVKNISEV